MKLRKRSNSTLNITIPKKSKIEPSWGDRLPTVDERSNAYNFYREAFKEKRLIEFFCEYLHAQNRTKEEWFVKNSVTWRVSKTACAIARILTNGNLMPEESIKFMDNHIKELERKIED